MGRLDREARNAMAILLERGHTKSDVARLPGVSEGTARCHDRRMREGAVYVRSGQQGVAARGMPRRPRTGGGFRDRGLVSGISKTEFHAQFEDIEELRNMLAHANFYARDPNGAKKAGTTVRNILAIWRALLPVQPDEVAPPHKSPKPAAGARRLGVARPQEIARWLPRPCCAKRAGPCRGTSASSERAAPP